MASARGRRPCPLTHESAAPVPGHLGELVTSTSPEKAKRGVPRDRPTRPASTATRTCRTHCGATSRGGTLLHCNARSAHDPASRSMTRWTSSLPSVTRHGTRPARPLASLGDASGRRRQRVQQCADLARGCCGTARPAHAAGSPGARVTPGVLLALATEIVLHRSSKFWLGWTVRPFGARPRHVTEQRRVIVVSGCLPSPSRVPGGGPRCERPAAR